MNPLRQEIRAALSELKLETSGQISARCRFPAEFTGFQGHFPGNPVLPGVCIAQVVIEVYSMLHSQAHLLEIIKAHFLRPVMPEETFTLRISLAPVEDGSILLHGQIYMGEEKTANLKLRVEHEK